MKHLSDIAKSIEPSVTEETTTISTRSRGLIKGAGKQIGQVKQAQALIDHQHGPASVKAQADSMRLLMLEKKPKRCYADSYRREETEDPYYPGKYEIKYFRKYFWKVPEVTDEQKFIIEQNRRACPKETIIDLITRYLEVHKKHIVEENKRLLLYTDMANLLYGLPEYALTLGILDIVNDASKQWFPVVGQIREAALEHLQEWPENLEPGEEPLK